MVGIVGWEPLLVSNLGKRWERVYRKPREVEGTSGLTKRRDPGLGLLSSTVRSPPTGWPAGLAEAGSWWKVCWNSLEQRCGCGAHSYGGQVAGLSFILVGFAGIELC